MSNGMPETLQELLLRVLDVINGAADVSDTDTNRMPLDTEAIVGKIASALESGGMQKLADQKDVAISSPSNNDVLTYDSSANKWKNAAGGGSGGLVVPTFTLDYDSDTATCDMTATEVINAVKTGTCISAVDDYGEFFYVNQLQTGGTMGDVVRFSNIVSMPESITSATIEIKNIDITSGGMIAFSYTDPVTIGS